MLPISEQRTVELNDEINLKRIGSSGAITYVTVADSYIEFTPFMSQLTALSMRIAKIC